MRNEAVDRVDETAAQKLAIVTGIDNGRNTEYEKNAGGFGERWSPPRPAYSGTKAGPRGYFTFFSKSFKYSTCFNSCATISSKITFTSGSVAVSANFI